MSIIELTAKIKSASQQRSHEQRLALLQSAQVLDAQGNFDKRFFKDKKTKTTKS